MSHLRHCAVLISLAVGALSGQTAAPSGNSEGDKPRPPAAVTLPVQVFGFRDFAQQAAIDREFLAAPSPARAREELKVLTAAPHWASSPEDYATAVYVAEQFKAAGLATEIVPYAVLMPLPMSLEVEAFADGVKIFSGPTPESPRPDPRSLPPFSSGSPSADVTAPVVYANYGRHEDFARLAELGTSVKGKIVLVRYGQIFRGTKIFLAQEAGAAGVLLFTDPADSSVPGEAAFPNGRNPPPTAVQRGSVQFLPIYPGDPTTPGVASVAGLPAADRIPVDKLQYDLPSIPSQPLSAADAAPILRAMSGAVAPREWQGAVVGAPYHLGSDEAPVRVHMRLAFDTRLRTIWDVIGRIPGTTEPGELVIAGNHRDAWVYGATDPSSGTAAMLEAVRGLGVLLKQGWRPRRTIVIGSWDAEEQGLIGATEWVEQHMAEMQHAVAYFNIDEAAAGPVFRSAAVPSLHEFVREIASEAPSAAGRGSVLDEWMAQREGARRVQGPSAAAANTSDGRADGVAGTPRFGELGSGSDYSPFLDHAGVPAADIGADGPFGVYHSAFDNFAWFTRFVDPDFALTVQQARVFGLEILHMADAEALPLDEVTYGAAIGGYMDQAKSRAEMRGVKLDLADAQEAEQRFAAAARKARAMQLAAGADTGKLNAGILAAEHALIEPEGLPARPWYRQAIYAPGLATGYAPEALPGINDAIDRGDAASAQMQAAKLAAALRVAAAALEGAAR